VDDAALKKVTQRTILDMLEQMKKVDSDTRYYILMEYFEVLFTSDAAEDYLFAPAQVDTL
tara:strand:- start:3593 stop:3772 length:180 start_codon:yes stop_codon:yes gene_type:complete